MVIYAMVPTGGISKAKAAKIALFLDNVANQGQQPGTQPGELAPGYLPLPQSLRQQTLKAADEVLNQTGNPKKTSTSTSDVHVGVRIAVALGVPVEVALALGVRIGSPYGALGRGVVQPPGQHRNVVGGAGPPHRRAGTAHRRADGTVRQQPGGTRGRRRRRAQDPAGRQSVQLPFGLKKPDSGRHKRGGSRPTWRRKP